MINKPQRQEPVGVLLEIGNTLFQFIRALWPMFIYLVFRKTENDNNQNFYLYLILFVVVALIVSVLRFLSFKFYIDTNNQEFVLQRGLLVKEKLIIALDKIFEVSLEQKYLHVLLGIYKAKLDTAGSDKDEVVIKSLSKKNADLLRNYILNYKKTANEVTPESETNDAADASIPNKINISLLSLFKSSLISNYLKTLGLILLFFNSIYENIKNFNEEVLSNYLSDFAVIQALSNSIAFTVILFCLLFLVIHLSLGVLQYFGYSITKNNQSLFIQYGLIQKTQIIVKPSRIQYYVFITSKLMRFLNINTMKLALIGNPADTKQKSSLVIPALQKNELEDITKNLNLNVLPTNLVLNIKPNSRMLLAPMFFKTLFLVVFAVYISVLMHDVIVLPMLILFLALIWIVFLIVDFINFKRFTISLFTNKIIIKQGALQLKTTVLDISKVQSINLKQAWWQASANLARLEIKTAGGSVNLPLANQSSYHQLSNYILFYIESNNISWE